MYHIQHDCTQKKPVLCHSMHSHDTIHGIVFEIYKQNKQNTIVSFKGNTIKKNIKEYWLKGKMYNHPV